MIRILCLLWTLLSTFDPVYAAVSTSTSRAKQETDGAVGSSKFASRSVGHNVSPTTNRLKKRELSVGTFFLGYGLSDNWFVGISPFVFSTYQMANFAARGGWDLTSKDRILIAAEYFKTFGKPAPVDQNWRKACDWPEDIRPKECDRSNYPKGFSSFEMEAWDIKFTYSRQLESAYRANLTVSYFYYINDERPFSLRMDPSNGDRYSLNLTSLHEVRLTRNVYLNLEGGYWGTNYKYPYLHYGSTINFQSKNQRGLIGIGVSTTHSPTFPSQKIKKFAGYDSRQSIHPEIQIQYYF